MASLAFDDLGREPEALHCLCLIGLKTWPQLVVREQEHWMMSAGKVKGVDCRADLERCYSVTNTAMCEIIRNRIRALKLPRKSLQFMVSPRGVDSGKSDVIPVCPQACHLSQEILTKHLQENPISAAETDSAIAEFAVEAKQQGHWIIAVASDFAQDEAELLMGKVYREQRLRREEALHVGKPRPRPKQWLKLISGFENAETSSGRANAQGFNPYRRVIDSIRFTLAHPPD